MEIQVIFYVYTVTGWIRKANTTPNTAKPTDSSVTVKSLRAFVSPSLSREVSIHDPRKAWKLTLNFLNLKGLGVWIYNLSQRIHPKTLSPLTKSNRERI